MNLRDLEFMSLHIHRNSAFERVFKSSAGGRFVTKFYGCINSSLVWELMIMWSIAISKMKKEKYTELDNQNINKPSKSDKIRSILNIISTHSPRLRDTAINLHITCNENISFLSKYIYATSSRVI